MPDSSTGDPVEAVVARYSGQARLVLSGGTPQAGGTCGDESLARGGLVCRWCVHASPIDPD